MYPTPQSKNTLFWFGYPIQPLDWGGWVFLSGVRRLFMLVLGRKRGEAILIGDDIRIIVVNILDQNKIRIGIEAPKDVKIVREEIADRADKD